ncbi:U3 small nucleolar RNA-associated protein Mpp10p [[Candida] jaroonii]|uniref:U3 small nucleolar RNA-associated protein Mpp10p n=1 Tax=[Candida] jaroonii TaxID=467808 RepID=A0ACA9Y3T7_9ASCO|nr:U3 small nucleolar RNA-associated protein Mpp10p [[Candida] jaroonii]
MSILSELVDDPTRIFNQLEDKESFFNGLIKNLGDSICKNSKLDEIYIDGLDSSQIFGQTKIVLENVGQDLMEKLADFKGDSEDEDEDDDRNAESDEEPEEFGETEEIQESDEEFGEVDEDGNLIDDFVDEPSGEEGPEIEDQEEESVENSEDEQPEDEESEEKEDGTNKPGNELNDEFFNIDEFNKQILSLEDNGIVEEFVDYNQELSDDEEVDYFDDFFDKPNSKKTKNLLESDDEDSEGEGFDGEEDFDGEDDNQVELEFDEKDDYGYKGDEGYDSLNEDDFNNALGDIRQDLVEKSSFEKQQEKLQQQIKQLEDELVAEKKWSMKGEVNNKQRPEGSLLQDEDNFEFERVNKPVPIITEEVTEDIEELIRRRIKSEEFNDLPKRLLNDIIKPQRVRTEVSETKSSKSLAEIYEDKFNGVEENNEKEEKLTQEHEEILSMINKLNYKLDSLTSFNFVPKPNENKIIEVKSSTISMEDSQPEFVSDNNRLAPQEIFNPNTNKDSNEISLKSGLSYSRDELSREEKQRLRRSNKRKRSKQLKSKEQKKSKTSSIIDTLSSNKNLTIIGKDGKKTDVKGNVKKQKQVDSNNLKL